MKIVLAYLALFMITSAVWIHAQNDRKPNHTVTFLPVGQAPPMKVIDQGGRRVEAEAPKGSIPPRNVHVIASGMSKSVYMKLGTATPGYRIRLGDTRGIRLATSVVPVEEAKNEEAWWQSKLPQGSRSLVILFRKPNARDWNQPLGMCLKNDAVHFPAGAVRVANVSSLPVIAVIGKKRPMLLKPGKHTMHRGGVHANQKVALYVKNNKGDTVRLYLNTITNNSHRRTNLVLHQSKPRSHGKPPVAVCVFHEKVVN